MRNWERKGGMETHGQQTILLVIYVSERWRIEGEE